MGLGSLGLAITKSILILPRERGWVRWGPGNFIMSALRAGADKGVVEPSRARTLPSGVPIYTSRGQ